MAAPPFAPDDAGRDDATGAVARSPGRGGGRRRGRGFRHPSHLHAEQIGTQRVDDREDEEPQQHEEPDAQQQEGQFTHGSGPPSRTSYARVASSAGIGGLGGARLRDDAEDDVGAADRDGRVGRAAPPR